MIDNSSILAIFTLFATGYYFLSNSNSNSKSNSKSSQSSISVSFYPRDITKIPENLIKMVSTTFNMKKSNIDIYSPDNSKLRDLVEIALEKFPFHSIPFNGHLQTFLCVLTDLVPRKIFYQREEIILSDQSLVSLDWSPSKQAFLDDSYTKPLIVLLHGLTGGSHENYLKDVVYQLNQKGFVCVVQNYRGCSGNPLKTPRFYSASNTEDLKEILSLIKSWKSQVEFIGIGFSLGANILTCYMGETGNNCEFNLGISVSNPWNLYQTCSTLKTTFMGKYIYLRRMGQNLKRLFKRNMGIFENNGSNIQIEKVLRVQYAHEFDEEVTCRVFQFPNADEYYKQSSSINYLPQICKPFISLQATDDPISLKSSIPFDQFEFNQIQNNRVLVTTENGGHLGWFQTCNLLEKIDRWHGLIISEWINDFCIKMKPRDISDCINLK